MSEHKLKRRPPSAEHLLLRGRLMDFLRKEMATVDAADILAILSNCVGQLVALQDQRKVTPRMAMEVVAQNIEAGNADAIREIAATPSSNPQ